MAPPSASRRGPGTRSGSTSGANVALVGVREFRRELKTFENPRRWSKEFGALNRQLAKDAAGWARFEASSRRGSAGHFADAIVGRGGVTGARVQINDEAAYGAFWGMKYPYTGWNARNSRSAPNQPDWIGNTWDVAERGQGPIAINDALANHIDEIRRRYIDGQAQIIENASAYWTESF